ncbi:MAG: alpha/beta hydrolase-fold protein [Phycisphaerae bacterium]
MRPATRRIRAYVVAAWLLSVPIPAWAQAKPSSADAALIERVTDYFREADPGRRKKLLPKIDRAAGQSIEKVADAIRAVQLWPEATAGTHTFELKPNPKSSTRVDVILPSDYDPKKPWPMILCLHGQGGRGTNALGYVRRLLDEQAGNFVLAAPTDYKGAWFMVTPADAQEPVDLLLELRRRYHVDTDRVYVLGYSMGGHGALTLASLYGDDFASAISLAGTLVVPYVPVQSILAQNLANVPVLAVWGENDVFDDSGKPAPGGGIAGLNENLMNLSVEMNLGINGQALPGVGHRGVDPPLDALRTFLDMRRDRTPSQIKHWFRYPVQGRFGWLRQRRFGGKPWSHTQLSIVAKTTDDINKYIVETVKKKLAYLGGYIENQFIEVTTRRTRELEVLLNDELIDPNQPITLKVNRKIRYEGLVKPRISTLLEVAYQDWDFQRLYSIRLVVGRKTQARQK